MEQEIVPWLKVKAILCKKGLIKFKKLHLCPNASDGPHYGANIKFAEGLGKYNVKFEVAAPEAITCCTWIRKQCNRKILDRTDCCRMDWILNGQVHNGKNFFLC